MIQENQQVEHLGRAIVRRLRNVVTTRHLLTPKTERALWPASVDIRQVDAGSCYDCEIEIIALNNPIYDCNHLGLRFVPSPRLADVLLITGPVTLAMEQALSDTYTAMPYPRRIVTVGDSITSTGIYSGSYALLPLRPDTQVEYAVAGQSGTVSAVMALPPVIAADINSAKANNHPIHWHVPGDPPSPSELLKVLRTLDTK